MLIPITAEGGSGLQEWALVELQGRIEPQPGVDVNQGLVVGTLQLSQTNKDVVQLQIGYHVLEGKRLPLKKPLAILEHHQPGSSSSSGDGDGEASGSSRGGGSGSGPHSGGGASRDARDGCEAGGGGGDASQPVTTCKVVGVLRHKYLFKTRPKALISKPTR